LLAAGPWATGSPATLDPSYWMPAVFATIGHDTGDSRWNKLAAGSTRMLAVITSGGRELPPDWVRLDRGAVSPEPAPHAGAQRIQYGLDAQRAPVWSATACARRGRALAAAWWGKLRVPTRDPDIALSLGGTVINASRNPLGYVAAAASAGAAGHPAAEHALLFDAVDQSMRFHTYYGDAWVALGRALLGHTVGLCGH
jgi:endoglucanase